MTEHGSLANHFNLHSIFMWTMNLSMLGMGLDMAGNIAGPHATIGDALTQSILMMGAYAVSFFTTGLPIGVDMLSNMFNGQILPTSFDMGAMAGGIHHGHSLHGPMHHMP